MKKSFSKADNNFIQLFKHKTKLTNINGDHKIKDLIIDKRNNLKTVETRKRYLDTTSAKLDKIISKLQKNNSYISQQFLEESNIQIENDELRERMKVLYKRRKTMENIKKKENDKRQYQINSIKEAIEHMLYFSKKYAIDKEVIRINYEQNNKKPPICRYTPSLNYISRHIPVVHFGYHNKNNKYINDNEKSSENIKVKLYKSLNINNTNNTLEEVKINTNNSIMSNIEEKKNNEENDIKNLKLNNNNNKKESNVRILKKITLNKSDKKEKNLLDKIIKKESRKKNKNTPNNSINNNKTNLDKLITINNDININKQIKKNIIASHSIMNYNISVPHFNKMISRDKNNCLIEKNKNMADYTPNYDAIYPSNYKHDIHKNDQLKKKKYKLRKILGSYNISEEYILLPILNKQ